LAVSVVVACSYSLSFLYIFCGAVAALIRIIRHNPLQLPQGGYLPTTNWRIVFSAENIDCLNAEHIADIIIEVCYTYNF